MADDNVPALPASLAYLDCSFNQLTALPTLLASLGQLFCRNNQLDFADLEAEHARAGHDESAAAPVAGRHDR